MSIRRAPSVEIDPKPSRPVAARRSRRAFGKIRRLPSGRYQASYIGEDGVRYVGPTTFELKMDADAWLSMMQASMTEHRWKPPVPSEDEPESPTLREYAATWLRNPPRRKTTDPLRRECGNELGQCVGPGRGAARPHVKQGEGAMRTERPESGEFSLPTDRAHAKIGPNRRVVTPRG